MKTCGKVFFVGNLIVLGTLGGTYAFNLLGFASMEDITPIVKAGLPIGTGMALAGMAMGAGKKTPNQSSSSLSEADQELIERFIPLTHKVVFYSDGDRIEISVGGFEDPVDWDEVRDLLNEQAEANDVPGVDWIESITLIG